jgi:hypothetical protein
MIAHDRNYEDEFDIDEAVDDIIDWVAHYAEQRGICPAVTSELLAMAAAKSRILTHCEMEHQDDEEEDNGR